VISAAARRNIDLGESIFDDPRAEF